MAKVRHDNCVMDTNKSLKIAILADDLTSAADGAAPFVTRGFAAVIGRGCTPGQAAPVWAVDSGSRSATVSQAMDLVSKRTSELASRSILYKTVDSTLRGHVSAELGACLKASGRKTLVLAPAFPAAGRTTVGGVQLVDSVPVSNSAYGRDPVHPARHSKLAELVPACAREVILLDATTQEELNRQIAALPEPESILWAGSPGMAIALAQRLVPAACSAERTYRFDGEILVAIGSANPISHRQAERIRSANGVTVLCGPSTRAADPTVVLSHISAEATQHVGSSCVGALIATGGDTMTAILEQLEIREFEVLQEFEAGFPLGRATLKDGRALLLAMKAGGFGDEDVLQRAIRMLRGAPSY